MMISELPLTKLVLYSLPNEQFYMLCAIAFSLNIDTDKTYGKIV